MIYQMHTNHWHAPVISYYYGDYGSYPEVDVELWDFHTHAEALAAFGHDDNDYYVYECDDVECLVDSEWWTEEYFSKLWGRND